jgi:hydroxyacylglutathione hydrolase
MKKRTKIITVIISILIALIVIPCAAFLIRFAYEGSTMKPVDTKLLADGVYSIRDDYVNMYIVKKQADIIAIDAGQNADMTKKELTKINIDPADFKAIFLTHTDYDHVGAIKLFKNAKVYISADEEQMVKGNKTRSLIFKNKLDVPYGSIKDGEELAIGGIKIRSILTPGHTPGSMCYTVDNSYLFTGDTISLIDGKAGHFNDFFNMDTPTEIKSINILKNLKGIKYIFTAHHGFSASFEKSFGEYKQ